MVHGAIPAVFAPLKHVVDSTQQFVRQGDDGALVGSPCSASNGSSRLAFKRRVASLSTSGTGCPAMLDPDAAIQLFDHRTRSNLGPMYQAQPRVCIGQLVPCSIPLLSKLRPGRWRCVELNKPEGNKSPTAYLTFALERGNPGY